MLDHDEGLSPQKGPEGPNITPNNGITPEANSTAAIFRTSTVTDEKNFTIIQQMGGSAAPTDSLGRLASTIYDSYLSTPNFMNRLCEISDNLIGLENKHDYLMEQLAIVNKQLPAAVYLPFVN